jgi:hypothetical protein
MPTASTWPSQLIDLVGRADCAKNIMNAPKSVLSVAANVVVAIVAVGYCIYIDRSGRFLAMMGAAGAVGIPAGMWLRNRLTFSKTTRVLLWATLAGLWVAVYFFVSE